MQQKPRSFSAILPAAWTTTPLAFPAPFWKGWMKPSPSAASALPAELRRSLACTNIISNMNGAMTAASAATSNAGTMPPWRCAGPALP